MQWPVNDTSVNYAGLNHFNGLIHLRTMDGFAALPEIRDGQNFFIEPEADQPADFFFRVQPTHAGFG